MLNDKAIELLTRSLANIETAKGELRQGDHQILLGQMNAVTGVIKNIIEEGKE